MVVGEENSHLKRIESSDYSCFCSIFPWMVLLQTSTQVGKLETVLKVKINV